MLTDQTLEVLSDPLSGTFYAKYYSGDCLPLYHDYLLILYFHVCVDLRNPLQLWSTIWVLSFCLFLFPFSCVYCFHFEFVIRYQLIQGMRLIRFNSGLM